MLSNVGIHYWKITQGTVKRETVILHPALFFLSNNQIGVKECILRNIHFSTIHTLVETAGTFYMLQACMQGNFL